MHVKKQGKRPKKFMRIKWAVKGEIRGRNVLKELGLIPMRSGRKRDQSDQNGRRYPTNSSFQELRLLKGLGNTSSGGALLGGAEASVYPKI